MGLDDLNESDFFNMIEFNGDVRHWSREGFTGSKTEEFYPATEENKNKAITSVLELAAGGGTNLNEAILAGLEVAETALQREALPRDVKSLNPTSRQRTETSRLQCSPWPLGPTPT